jgi:putative ABC transport system permease protein
MRMDNNNNGAVIKNIARKSLASSKTRNIFTCLTIAMGVALVLTFVLYIFGNSMQQQRRLEDSPQVTYLNITSSQLEQLKENGQIKWMGASKSVGSGKVGNNRVGVIYQDELLMEKNEVSYEGRLPEKDGEIMVPRDYLEILGIQAQPGAKVSMDLGDGTVRDYTLTGIVKNPSKASNNHRVYASLPCAIFLTGDEKGLVDATVNLKNAVNMTFPQAEEIAKEMGAAAGLTEKQVKVSESFFNQAGIVKLSITSIVALALVALLILAAAGLVIGGIMGYLLVPKGWDWKTTLGGMAVCAFLGFAAVRMSVRKPGKIAAKTAPVEAISYTGYSSSQDLAKKRYQYLTPANLAMLNLKRSKKKSILTMCSLILAGVLLGAICSFVVSYKPSASIESSYPYGEFQIQLTAESGFGNQDISEDGRMKQYSALQSSGTIGKELRDEVEGIDGVTETRPWSYLNVSTDLFGKETNTGINGISEGDFAWIKKMGYEGPASYEELVKSQGLVVEVESNSNFKDFPVHVGDMIHVITYNGSGEKIEKDFPVAATFHHITWMKTHKEENKKLPLSIMGSTLIMPAAVLDEWAGMDTTYGFEIATDPKKTEDVGKKLESLYGAEENLYIASKMESIEYLEQMFLPGKIILFVLAGFLVVFGVINLMNTILTNLFTRKRELGIFQAVGMTKGQLKKMLGRESLIYVGITIACTITAGGALGYLLVGALDDMGMGVKYQYPWFPVLLFIVILTAMQTGMTRYGVSLLQKQSLAERMGKVD